MDRLDEWQIFVAVATRRSFSGAARALGRSPQVVTRAIAGLEQRLGTRLLARTTRSVSLTDDGARHLDEARRLLTDLDALEAAVADRGALRGGVTIAAPVLFGQLHVAPIVRRFLVEHADVDARLLLHDRVVALADEGVDLAVRIGVLPDSALRARACGHVRTVVCASPAYLASRGTPKTLESLARHDGISFVATSPLLDRWTFPEISRGQRSGAGLARDRTAPIRARLTVNTGQAAIDAALAGLGLVRLLSYQVDEHVTAGRLRILLRRFEPPPLPIHLVQLPGVQRRAAAALADRVVETLRRRFA